MNRVKLRTINPIIGMEKKTYASRIGVGSLQIVITSFGETIDTMIRLRKIKGTIFIGRPEFLKDKIYPQSYFWPKSVRSCFH